MDNGQWEMSVNVKMIWTEWNCTHSEYSGVHCLHLHCWYDWTNKNAVVYAVCIHTVELVGPLTKEIPPCLFDGIPKPPMDSHQNKSAGWGNSSHKQKKWPNVWWRSNSSQVGLLLDHGVYPEGHTILIVSPSHGPKSTKSGPVDIEIWTRNLEDRIIRTSCCKILIQRKCNEGFPFSPFSVVK